MKRSMLSYVAAVMAVCIGLSHGASVAQAQDSQEPSNVAVLQGAVLTEGDAPVQEARVFVRDKETKTDAQGQFALELPFAGPAVVRVFKEGYRPAVETVVLSFDQSKTVDFRLKLQERGDDRDDDEDEEEEVESDGEIEIKVVDKATQVSITGAAVQLGETVIRTDRDGEVEFEDLAAGEYALNVTAAGYVDFEQTLTLQEDQELELTVELEQTDAQTPPVEPVTGDVEGSVKDALSGQPLNGAFVRIGSIVTTTDADGQFTFKEIQAGEVTVLAKAEGYLPQAQTILVTEDGTVSAHFLLEKRSEPQAGTGQVHVIVVSEEDGLPVTGASLRLGDADAVTTGETNEFTFENVRPGRLTLTVSAEGYDEETVRVLVRSGDTAEVTVELEEEEIEEPQPSPATGTLNGTVLSCPDTAFGEDGAVKEEECTVPVAGAVVKVGRHRTVTDENGQYSLSGLPLDEVKVEIHKAGFQSVERKIEIEAEQVNTLNVILFANERDRDEDDEESPATGQGTISGTVLNEDQQPVEGAIVMLRGVRVVTDGAGRYEFTNLANGNYHLQVWAKGFRHTHKKVELTSEEPDATLDFTLHLRKNQEETDKGGDDKIGDADEDGAVTVIDAVNALRAAIGLDDLSKDALKKARMDVAPAKPGGDFGDDDIDIRDAIKLLKVAAKLDRVLP